MMRAIRYAAFGQLPALAEVAEPTPERGGVVVEVRATGLCRSDWHGWQGHDPGIGTLPHTPGHEFAGVVTAVGEDVTRVAGGDRVVVPFVCGCGRCEVCRAGATHVCPHQWQSGFSGPGSFAEQVAVPWADTNVVPLPEDVGYEVAASLGCRFATAYRGIVDVAEVREGEQVAVLGCGGVGLAAVMIAAARGAEVVAVDVDPDVLSLAVEVGARHVVDGSTGDVPAAIRARCPDGVHVAVDALGSPGTARDGVLSLRVHGRHLQVGLLPPAVVEGRETVPMHTVIAHELAVLGSHGMPAADYPRLLADVAGGLEPERLITRRIALDETPAALAAMGGTAVPGVTVIVP